MQRIIVIGTSGSGKTTLARQIAARLALPHIEQDALYWEDGWQEAPPEVFRERVRRAITCESWVLDGNYRVTRDLTWLQAETLIWLDYPRWLVMWRITVRSLKRVLSRQPLWGTDNRETFRKLFLSRGSVIWWAWTTYTRRRREYPQIFQQPQYAHLTILRFTTPRETRRWLDTLPAAERAVNQSTAKNRCSL